jgi:hypothetical protein
MPIQLLTGDPFAVGDHDRAVVDGNVGNVDQGSLEWHIRDPHKDPNRPTPSIQSFTHAELSYRDTGLPPRRGSSPCFHQYFYLSPWIHQHFSSLFLCKFEACSINLKTHLTAFFMAMDHSSHPRNPSECLFCLLILSVVPALHLISVFSFTESR